ncbi:hypothetical protein [Pseudoalteromonas piscicida]|uniref:hypothetical protein n=1 Tax=Pseudoalteromonas piscicida TaxID=43662 RepID=UPI001C965B1F|nr:hypothetical protein [Pseudoalteromonas piscicida]QZO11283.1 hypothetical protein K5642_08965 [Pseudoalteromonas piscicida]
MKIAILTLLLSTFLVGCSGEPTDAEIEKRVSTLSADDCKRVDQKDEYKKMITAIKKKCASLQLREFEAKESSGTKW